MRFIAHTTNPLVLRDILSGKILVHIYSCSWQTTLSLACVIVQI